MSRNARSKAAKRRREHLLVAVLIALRDRANGLEDLARVLASSGTVEVGDADDLRRR